MRMCQLDEIQMSNKVFQNNWGQININFQSKVAAATVAENNWGQINIYFQSVGAEANGGLTIGGNPP